MIDPIGTLLGLVMVTVLMAVITVLSLLLLHKNRRAKRLDTEIRAVSAERNGLRQEVSELLQRSRHKPQSPVYPAMPRPHPGHQTRRNTYTHCPRTSAYARKPYWQT